MPALVYANSKGEHQELVIEKPVISVGRQAGNDIVLPDPLVSRKHCTIRKDDSGFILADLGSTYGTFVNDERVDGDKPLKLGDRLRIGNTAMKFVEPDSGVKMTSAGAFEDTGSMSLSKTLADARDLADELSAFFKSPSSKAKTGAPAETAELLVERLADTQAALAAMEQTQRLTQTLGEVGKALAHIPDLDTVFRLTMDLAIRALRADRGFILVEEQGKLETKVSRNMGDVRGISTSIAEKVFQECKPVLTTDAQADPRFNTAHSVMMNAIRAVMCVPLELAVKEKTNDRVGVQAIGAIYVDGSPGNRMFNERGLEFLAGFAHQAAVAIQNARLAEKSVREEKTRQQLERYFSEAVINEIVKKGGQLGGESRIITLLFTDIRGFTAMLEKLQPREAVEMLNEYFSELVDEILAQGGTLDKFTGDGVMAFWNAPTEQADHAARAVRAALRIQARIPALLARWRGEGRPFVNEVGDLGTGIGINTGEAVVGNIGSAKRVDYTAIGDAVNLTARVQGHAKGGEVLVTGSTRELLGRGAKTEELPPVVLKGKSKSVPIFRVVSAD